MQNRIITVTRSTVGDAPEGPLVSDSFDRADSTSLGMADTGQAWEGVAAEFGVIGNEAYKHSGATNPAAVEAGATNVYVSTNIRFPEGRAGGIALRYMNNSNYMYVQMFVDRIELFKRTSAGYERLAQASFPVKQNVVYLLETIVSGITYDVRVDGVTYLTVTEPFQEGMTKHGLVGSPSNNPRWDSFRVEAA